MFLNNAADKINKRVPQNIRNKGSLQLFSTR